MVTPPITAALSETAPDDRGHHDQTYAKASDAGDGAKRSGVSHRGCAEGGGKDGENLGVRHGKTHFLEKTLIVILCLILGQGASIGVGS